MKQMITLKDFIDQQYELQKRGAEILDKIFSKSVDLLPKAPTPAEIIDSAMEINKLTAKVVQDELANVAKQIYNFK